MSVEHYVASSVPEIHFSEAAICHIAAYLDKQPGHEGVRLSVKKQGCSGYAYVVDYVKALLETDITLPLTDKYSVSIDKKSLPYLQGLTVDYVKQGLNAKFIFDNPNQTGQCGCGESFTVD